MNKPLLICMTPVRNEAWVLHAFLKATSLWADYIIIANQMSTDGSREIALSYPKVILIDNNNPEFNEAERQSLLIKKAREVANGRDTILFGLDADEIFSANFMETNDWKKIVCSRPGDVFWFKWAEILPSMKEYWMSPTTYYPWMFHDDGKEPHGNYVRNMHSMRIPYPIEEKQMYYVDDFRVLHLAYLNTARVQSKNRFYKFVDYEMNHRSIIVLSRSYTPVKKEEKVYPLSESWIYNQQKNKFNLFASIDLLTTRFWFDSYVVRKITTAGEREFRNLDIWQKQFISDYKLKDPRSLVVKIIHYYLFLTKNYYKNILIRSMDKLLKKYI